MSTKIIICNSCKGWGKIECEEVEDYHKNDKIYWDEKCPQCNGYGRLIKIKEYKEAKSCISMKTVIVGKLTDKDLKINKRKE